MTRKRIQDIEKDAKRKIQEVQKQEKRETQRKKALDRKKRKDLEDRLKKAHAKERVKYTRRVFEAYLRKAGIDSTFDIIRKQILIASSVLVVIAFLAFLTYLIINSLGTVGYVFFILLSFATFGLGLVYGFIWFIFHQIIDYRIYKRRQEVESVLADFLLLTSANVRAGMTIDKALWNAVRPRFGILAREIETVAKKTLSGESLESALYEFAQSYDSPLLQRSISLLIEGLNAGGEIGELLNNIALNIQEISIIRQEMASNVTTYAIFINFATLVAAPALYALAGQLLTVISQLTGEIDIDQSTLAQAGVGFTFSGGASLAYSDFFIFAMLTLFITTIFSTVIVATIQRGDAKEAFMKIPIQLVVTITIFLVASFILGQFLGDII